MSVEKANISRLLAVRNPASTRAAAGEGIIDGLMATKKWAGRVEVVSTHDPAEANNVELIAETINPGDAILSLGGDGLAHTVVNSMVELERRGLVGGHEVVLVPCPAGSSNDLSKSIYGHNIFKGHRLLDLLDSAQFDWLDGIRIERDHSAVEYAHGFVGIGVTGVGAALLNEGSHREKRPSNPLLGKLYDGRPMLGAILSREPIAYTDEAGAEARLQELTYSIIPRIAGGLIRLDTQPFDRKMIGVEIGPDHFWWEGVIKRLAIQGLIRGGIKGDVVRHRELAFASDAPVHYDGESEILPAGTHLAVSHQIKVARSLVNS